MPSHFILYFGPRLEFVELDVMTAVKFQHTSLKEGFWGSGSLLLLFFIRFYFLELGGGASVWLAVTKVFIPFFFLIWGFLKCIRFPGMS